MYDPKVVVLEIKDGTTKELVGTITVVPDDSDPTFWYKFNAEWEPEIVDHFWGSYHWTGRCVPHYELKHRIVGGCPAGML